MVSKKSRNKQVVCVVGLGYVGLPLVLAFGRSEIETIGFDIDQHRVDELKRKIDRTNEISQAEIASSKVLFTSSEKDIAQANFIIVAVPTPINKANQPDLSLLESASMIVGRSLKKGATVVYESTVYPGATEEVCAPILEKESGLKRGKDFKIGYSPERINPGDHEHTLERIIKVVSGEDAASSALIADTYRVVCLAGVHVAPNIKTAEAAKVIENTQRDLNIALINELSLIFQRVGINTHEVLEAAGTKWNFLKFYPGLVGGHCIGVDPYYLVHKAEELGYHPQVITAGRRVNDYMPKFVAEETVRSLIKAGAMVQESKVLVMGLTFKENVKDIRNSKIADTITYLKDLGVEVIGYDPLLSKEEIKKGFGISSTVRLEGYYDGIIIATPHSAFQKLENKIEKLFRKSGVIMDVKRAFPYLSGISNIIYKSL